MDFSKYGSGLLTIAEARKLLRVEGVLTTDVLRAAFRKQLMILHNEGCLGVDANEVQQSMVKTIIDAKNTLKSTLGSKSNTGQWTGLFMAKQPESKFVNELKSAVESMGGLYFKVHGHVMQASGWPDIQVYHPKWTGHLEAKVDSEKYSTLQLKRMFDLRRLGTAAFGIRKLPSGWVHIETDYVPLVKVDWNKIPAQGNSRGLALLEACQQATALSTK